MFTYLKVVGTFNSWSAYNKICLMQVSSPLLAFYVPKLSAACNPDRVDYEHQQQKFYHKTPIQKGVPNTQYTKKKGM